nr:hypothetical protein [Tanacetum cinerariifolium]
MISLADKAILSGADNRPPMLEKDMYDSWKSRMKLYMLNQQHGRMILEYVESGPLLWPTIEENGVTLLKKYSELSTKKPFKQTVMSMLQTSFFKDFPRRFMHCLADKAILSGADNRPPMLEKDMYDSWKSRMKLYMLNQQHGRMILEYVESGPLLWPTIEENGVTLLKKYSELSTKKPFKQTVMSMLQTSFFKDFPRRFMHCKRGSANCTMSLISLHTGRDSHSYASQAPSSTPLSLTYPSNDFQSFVNHNVYYPLSSMPHVEYALVVHPQSEFSPPDTGLVVLVFQKGDDLINAINHMMSFLTSVVTSRYPATFNQIRTSSNPRQHTTINNRREPFNRYRGGKIL